MLKAGITPFQKLKIVLILHFGIDEGYHLLAVQQLNQGQTLRKQKRKYRELNERILRFAQSYNLQNIIEYFKNIATNLKI
ncbi:hypothetical protein HZS_2800 [Henneguya salminicola]|nr:hypothetical protein HZS_2800 [Henneguya salminicola]